MLVLSLYSDFIHNKSGYLWLKKLGILLSYITSPKRRDRGRRSGSHEHNLQTSNYIVHDWLRALAAVIWKSLRYYPGSRASHRPLPASDWAQQGGLGRSLPRRQGAGRRGAPLIADFGLWTPRQPQTLLSNFSSSLLRRQICITAWQFSKSFPAPSHFLDKILFGISFSEDLD